MVADNLKGEIRMKEEEIEEKETEQKKVEEEAKQNLEDTNVGRGLCSRRNGKTRTRGKAGKP